SRRILQSIERSLDAVERMIERRRRACRSARILSRRVGIRRAGSPRGQPAWGARHPCLLIIVRFPVDVLSYSRATAPRGQRKSSFQPATFTKRNPKGIRESLHAHAQMTELLFGFTIFELQIAEVA